MITEGAGLHVRPYRSKHACPHGDGARCAMWLGGLSPWKINSDIVANPQKTVLGRKHVVLAINRENPSTGSTWVCARENTV